MKRRTAHNHSSPTVGLAWGSPRRLLLILCAALIWHGAFPAAGVLAAGQEISFSIGAGVSNEDEAYVREGITLAQAYVAETLSPFPESDIVVNVRNNRDSTGGHAAAFSGGAYIVVFTRSPGWRTSAPFERVHVVVHEYVHSWQWFASGGASAQIPLWLIEGTAEYAAYDAVAQAGLVRPQEVSDFHTWSVLASEEMPPLHELEARAAFYNEPGPVYSLAYLAVAHLLGNGSPAEIDRFFRLVGSGEPWRDAFVETFGQDVESFYQNFAEARAELMGPRDVPEPFASTKPTHSESPIVLGAAPDAVQAGEQLTVLAQSEPGATCTVRLRGAESGQRLTRTTFADGDGRLFWLITIPPDFGEGPAVLTAACGGDGVSHEFTVSGSP